MHIEDDNRDKLLQKKSSALTYFSTSSNALANVSAAMCVYNMLARPKKQHELKDFEHDPKAAHGKDVIIVEQPRPILQQSNI